MYSHNSEKAPRLDMNVAGQWRARPDAGNFDATSEKPLMDLESAECPDGFWPVYKGESFDLWTPDTGIYYAWADPGPVHQRIQAKRLRARNNTRSAHSRILAPHHLRDLGDSAMFCSPRSSLSRMYQELQIRGQYESALVPPEVFITNKRLHIFFGRAAMRRIRHSYSAHCHPYLSIGMHGVSSRVNLNFFIINPFPIPRPDRDSVLWQRVVQLAGRLACPDERFSTWADAVGVKYGSLAADEKEDMIHELDAVVARLYGLSEPQLIHIYETFHEGWDYQARLDGVLKHFHAWRGRE